MQPEHLTRLYNGFHGAGNKVGEFGGGNKPGYPDAARLFEKDREQLLHMAGRNFSGANVGFQIELEERDVDRRRGVFGREHEWGEDAARSRAGEESFTGIVGGGGGGGGGRNHDSHSDGSEDYDDEELDLEADGRDVLGEGVAGERNSHVPPPLTPVPGQDGVAGPFQRMNAPPDNAKASAQKFGGMFPFFNTFAHDNGVRGRPESEGNGVPDPMYFNTMMNTAATPGERRAPPAQQENSVRHFLSDPISGALMEDALIFPCGHSVGGAGFQRVQETKACVVCMAPTAPMSAAPNHALRAAVQAFKRDREFPIMTNSRSAKRRREPDEDTGNGKPKGVQFPYSVSDRVLIKGNKRTPERFVGREAIITTQCLNGWYLVRTIDNGESVRLQYRSLQKIGD